MPDLDKVSKELCRLNLASQDFRSVKAMADNLIANPVPWSDYRFRPFMAGIVVTYCRSFVRNDGIGPLGKKFATFDDEIMRVTHQRLKDMRNGVYGHRDREISKSFTRDALSTKEPYVFEIRFEDAENTRVSCNPNAPELNPENLSNIVKLCSLQADRVAKDITKLILSLAQGKKYPPGRMLTLGVDFP